MSYIPEHLTLWKRPSNYAGAEWPEFYPVIGRHRDSDILTESNFEHIRAALEAEDAGIDGFWRRSEVQPEVIIVRESCSMVGWQEWIGVREDAEAKLRLADGLAGSMEDYPVLDEDDFSRREMEDAEATWANCYNVRERLDLIREANERRADHIARWPDGYHEKPISAFAARHDYPPQDDWIDERLRG